MPNTLAGYTGISFPFRIGARGGVVLSSTDRHEFPHIEESIVQILGTRPMERWMEYHVFSDLDVFAFEPNDGSLRSLLLHQIRQALRHDARVSVHGIKLEVDGGMLWAEIDFSVDSYRTAKPLRMAFDRNTGLPANGFFPMRYSA